ncbi:MAG: rhodanese-like domain-containing protein [Alphaproteobacteria bacterium]
MKKGFKAFLAEANAIIETCSVQDAIKMLDREDTVFIDVRDARELEKEGKVPGAVHVSRGFLEFSIDPESPLHDPVFASGKRFVFYCGTGGRSALATHRALEMGLRDVRSLAGGFNVWKAEHGPVEPVSPAS